jgi:putative endonuclease
MMAFIQQTLHAAPLEWLQTPRQIRDVQMKRLGKWGESIARSYLRRQGYVIEKLNWRAGRLGEVDLILVNPREQIRVFVEVKTRRGFESGSPLEAVTPIKQKSLYHIADCYLQHIDAQSNAAYAVRMDVVGITFPGKNRPAVIEHIQNAF